MITMEEKIPLICIVGPTASGKTSLAIKLAKIFDGEIVSADSMQIYKGMDIATAKPSLLERDGIIHHLIDFLEIDKSFSVAQYCEIAHSIIKDIHTRGKTPILVGGTGLYVDSLLNNITFSDADSDEKLREELYEQYTSYGVDFLLDKLSSFDKCSAQRLSTDKNVKRIIRAIEVYQLTGITMTEHNEKSTLCDSPYRFVKIGLTATNRQYLYDRINRRVDIMVENGLVDEAREYLSKHLSTTSSMAIGHKELLPYLNGEVELETCLENLKMQTRRYAKRQLTWFKRDLNINWLDIDTLDEEELLNKSEQTIKKVLFNE
ncbi:MAG: tRNA (adenosine(37)-N6)-dimethylallyltransferase MiaA [Ruminococcaceae bacterium]|nr:tRNA (adenosine(37)-N6)-dimethylallyltransferase MiaA [Oscillospiraceae bacterium]